MKFDNELVGAKLARWDRYLNNYQLPRWNEIPNIGLYMEQVVEILKQYLDYLPPELKEEEFITRATINNYVRKNIMPSPVNKKYYRIHIAYLIVICSLKQALNLSLIQKIMPVDMSECDVEKLYTAYANRHRVASQYFSQQVGEASAGIFGMTADLAVSTDKVFDLIVSSAVISNFSSLLAEKLILIGDKKIEDFDESQLI